MDLLSVRRAVVLPKEALTEHFIIITVDYVVADIWTRTPWESFNRNSVSFDSGLVLELNHAVLWVLRFTIYDLR